MGKFLLCAAVFVSTMKGVLGAGSLDIKFMTYRSNGRDNSGSCCDLTCDNPCDPYFKICIGIRRNCRFYNRTSGTFHEMNNINFGSSIRGLANPIVIPQDSIPDEFSVRVTGHDQDPTSGNDFIADVTKNWMVVDVTFNGLKGDYHEESFGGGIARFKVGFRVYCDVYHYGDKCDVYCKEDADGQYTCDPTTGGKVCTEGQTGPDCTTDINEYRLNVSCPDDTNCTDAALDCNGCYINNFCHNNTNCTSIQDDITCDGCYLLNVCHDSMNCTQILDELECDGCYVNGSCQTGANCTEDCDGCYIAGYCYNGTNCTDIDRESACDGCLVAEMCHEGDRCSSIDWEPQCQGCEIDHVCQHGGVCANLPGGFNCTCQPGFEGDTCEETSHECVINPCQYGGSCTGNETDFTCGCLPWRGGATCEEAVDTCDEVECFNNATCTSNNDTLPGYTCTCELTWGGNTCEYLFGDPYIIQLQGEITDNEREDLEQGLADLIRELGGLEGEIFVRVNTTTSTVNGVTVTTVEVQATGEEGPVNTTIYDSILEDYTEERINTYLPFPVFIPTREQTEAQGGPWMNSNWYIVVIAVIVGLVLVVIVAVILFLTRRHWNRKVIFVRSESSASTSVLVSNSSYEDALAVENPLYRRNDSLRNSDIIDDEDATFALDQTLQTRPLPSPGIHDVDPLYSEAISETSHYDTPVKQVAENGQCGSHQQTLDTRCQVESNPYTDFSNLDGAKQVSPYADLDDITIQKVINAVGEPENMEDTKSDEGSEDSEEDIDKIKASLGQWQSEA